MISVVLGVVSVVDGLIVVACVAILFVDVFEMHPMLLVILFYFLQTIFCQR